MVILYLQPLLFQATSLLPKTMEALEVELELAQEGMAVLEEMVALVEIQAAQALC